MTPDDTDLGGNCVLIQPLHYTLVRKSFERANAVLRSVTKTFTVIFLKNK